MSHASHDHAETPPMDTRPNTYSQSALWFSLILIALFLSLVNFVKIMGEEESHGSSASTEVHSDH